MSVFDDPGSGENQLASGAESAEGLSVEGHLVRQKYTSFSIMLYLFHSLAEYVFLIGQWRNSAVFYCVIISLFG